MPVIRLFNSDAGSTSTDDDLDFFIGNDSNSFISDSFGFSFGDSINNNLIVGGTIVASGDGVADGAGANRNTVTVLSTGSITGNNGVRLDGGTEYDVFNNGEITAFGRSRFGVFLDGDIGHVTNNGAINSNGEAIFLFNSSGFGGGVFDVHNTGTVSGVEGILVFDSSATIINSGTISGQTDGILIESFNTFDTTLTISNSGLISGGDNAVFSSEAAVTLDNSGEVFGNITLSIGDDRIDTRSGIVSGDIDLGGGNDVAIGSQEDDTIIAGAGDDIVRAGGDDDTVTGGDGNDILRGAGGEDDLRGEDDNDLIFGGTGDDVIRGNTGNDELRGGAGDDNMAGGSGDDEIHGGRGDDNLTGNSGADVFVFNASAGNDTIFDFRVDLDMIDLSAFGTRFNRVDAATEVVNGNAIIDLDMLGGEGTIVVRGVGSSLDANDFIF